MKTACYRWHSFSVPKAGNQVSENEDILFPSKRSGEGVFNSGQSLEFILTDGATQTSFAGLWGKNLVEACSQYSVSNNNLFLAISKAQEEWKQSINLMKIPWHAVEKVKKGAFAALCWIEIKNDPLLNSGAFTWKALSVGDCCLFLVRSKMIILSFPIQELHEFQKPPVLIPSRKEYLQSIYGNILNSLGTLRENDQIMVVSDALAGWILAKSKSCPQNIVSILEFIKSPYPEEAFFTKITALRKTGELKNDDTSMIFIEIGTT